MQATSALRAEGSHVLTPGYDTVIFKTSRKVYVRQLEVVVFYDTFYQNIACKNMR